jgi:hypothetical protein
MANPHRGAGHASRQAAAVSRPRDPKQKTTAPPVLEEKESIQSSMKEFIQALTGRGAPGPDLELSRRALVRSDTYSVSCDASLVPSDRLTSEANIQSSLREFVTTLQANSAIFDKKQHAELLQLSLLLQSGPVPGRAGEGRPGGRPGARGEWRERTILPPLNSALGRSFTYCSMPSAVY